MVMLLRGHAFVCRYLQMILILTFLASFYLVLLLWSSKDADIAVKIAVLTILKDRSNIEEYRLAMETFECYCIHQRYSWVVIDISRNDTLRLLCPQDQFFFQRHCVTAQFLQENSYDYLLFVDSDMGVINPKRRIEEYIIKNKDIVFYNRIWNFEVMAGSFLAKNTKFVISFLRMWANYNYRVPHSFHGSDNAAVHTVLLHIASANVKKSYSDVFVYEACVRAQLEINEHWKSKIAVLPKGQSWARDGWLTDSKWGEKDFVFHGWQKRRLNAKTFASWKLPFLSTQLNMSLCSTIDFMQNWKYNKSFVRDPNDIQIELNTVISLKENEYGDEKRRGEETLVDYEKEEMISNNSSSIVIH